MLGPFVDATDGVTPETALTITQPDIRLSKNGGAFAQKSAAQTLTHGENGWYPCNLSTTDTGAVGTLIVAVNESGALPVWREFQVVPAIVYDALVGSGTAVADLLDVSVTQWNGGAVPATSATGVPKVDVSHWLGTAAATPTTAGVPEVDVTHFGGTAGGFNGGIPQVNTTQFGGIAGTFATGRPEVNTSHWLGTAAQGAAGRPQVDLELWLGVAPNALVSNRVDVSVGAMATDVITNTALAASAVTEIQTGLAPATDTTAILADTNELQTDWVNGGRLDLLLDAIKAQTDLIPGTLDGKTFAQITQLVAAVLLGKASGLPGSPVYRSINDGADRVSATTDSNGNRSAVTLNNA